MRCSKCGDDAQLTLSPHPICNMYHVKFPEILFFLIPMSTLLKCIPYTHICMGKLWDKMNCAKEKCTNKSIYVFLYFRIMSQSNRNKVFKLQLILFFSIFHSVIIITIILYAVCRCHLKFNTFHYIEPKLLYNIRAIYHCYYFNMDFIWNAGPIYTLCIP